MKFQCSAFSKILCVFWSLLLLLVGVPGQAFALISNGANAVNVAGQLTSAGAITYVKGGANSGPNNRGFNNPYDVEIDAVNHRLFVLEVSVRRVLVFNLNASNLLTDYTADFVLGQVDFETAVTGVSQSVFSQLAGLAYDSTNQRLFVSDTGNNRVMVFDVASITNGENAVSVLGQANFTASATATTQAGLSGPWGMRYDGGGNRLFVTDITNNRIMVFDVASITNGENAVSVLGQANFTASASATTQSGLYSPSHLAHDSAGNRLFVADASNNRVMVFDITAITNGENAANVLGQANFTSSGLAATQSGFNVPRDLAYDSVGNRLFVTEANNRRVMVFDVASISDGENAANVLGQANFTASEAGVTQATLYNPHGAAYDSGSGQLFVADATNNRIMVFDVATIINGESATNALGQLDPALAVSYIKKNPNNGPSGIGFDQPDSMVIDTANHRLFVSDFNNYRVLVFNLTASDTLTDYTADFVLGASDLTTGTIDIPSGVPITQSSLYYPEGLAYDSAGGRLFVADRDHNRVMVFDVATITNGENAVNVLGQANFTSNTEAATQSGLSQPIGLAYDSANQRLFVGDSANYRVMVFDVASITNGENAVNVLGQANFTTATPGTTQSQLNSLSHLTYDSTNQRLFVVDSPNSRVMVFDVTAITNGENAVNVLGQTDFVSSNAGTTQSGLSVPDGITYDNSLNYLYVADLNHRVLLFDVSSISNGENAIAVLGNSTFTDSSTGLAQNRMNYPVGLFLNPANGHLWVADRDNHRLLVFESQAAGGSGSSVKYIQAQINLKLSLGGHRDSAFLRIVNQLINGERLIKDRASISQLLLNRSGGLKEFTTMKEIQDRPAFRATLLQLATENPEVRSLLRGQQSDKMLLEVWPAGDRSSPSVSLAFSTNIFGEASVSLPSLASGSYDFTVRKPFGLRQTLSSQTLSDSMTLDFPNPIRVGDLNGDGLINVIDFKAFLETFGNVENDFNEDGVADLQDVVEFLRSIE